MVIKLRSNVPLKRSQRKITTTKLTRRVAAVLAFITAGLIVWGILNLRKTTTTRKLEEVDHILNLEGEIYRLPSIIADSEDYILNSENCSIPLVPVEGQVLRRMWNRQVAKKPLCHSDPGGIHSTFDTNTEVRYYFEALLTKGLVGLRMAWFARKANWESEVTSFCSKRALFKKIQILEIHNVENFKSCCYKEIKRPTISDGDSYDISGKCIPYKNKTRIVGIEYFFIECNIRSNVKYRGGVRYRFHANVPMKEVVREKEKYWNSKGSKAVPVSVSILVLDSVSRIHAYRSLTKTMRYLLESLNFIDFRGHHIMGEPTMPNMLSLLLGEASATEFWKKKKPDWTANWDHYAFIWKNFAAKQYVTFYSEDNARVATFNYGGQRGFREQPTDYYTRPLFAAHEEGMFSSVPSHGACFGNETASQFALNYHAQFLAKTKSVPTFSVNWLTVPQHDVMEAAVTLDDPLLRYFKKISSDNQFLENTVLIVMSDHGFWSNAYARTYQGLLERRLPLLLVRLPDNLIKRHPEYLSALEKNSNVLTSHVDVYQTLVHLASMASDKMEEKPSLQVNPKPASTPQKGLLGELPTPRSCTDAGIPRHICTCSLPLPDDNPEYMYGFIPESLQLPLPMPGPPLLGK